MCLLRETLNAAAGYPRPTSTSPDCQCGWPDAGGLGLPTPPRVARARSVFGRGVVVGARCLIILAGDTVGELVEPIHDEACTPRELRQLLRLYVTPSMEGVASTAGNEYDGDRPSFAGMQADRVGLRRAFFT